MLGFLEKMTLSPRDLGPGDVAPLRAAGLTDQEIADAIHICGAFNLINRLADSLGWEAQKEVAIHRFAEMLLKMGYK
jgi:alkylhydroperoxidase family enzyme